MGCQKQKFQSNYVLIYLKRKIIFSRSPWTHDLENPTLPLIVLFFIFSHVQGKGKNLCTIDDTISSKKEQIVLTKIIIGIWQ